MKRLLVSLLMGFLMVALFSISAVANDFTTYQVNRGDTPATIAHSQLKDARMFPMLMKYNGITSPDQLQPGTVLRIPFSISKQRRARVSFVQGRVVGSPGTNNFNPLAQGTVLLEGHRVQTAANSRIEIVLDEGSVIRIGPETRFVLSGYNYGQNASRNTNTNLESGSMNMRVTRLTQSSNFNVSTVTAVAGVRGTFFYVNYDEDSQDVGIAVYSGAVAVSAENDVNHVVNVDGGYATVIHGGQDIEDPFPIPGRIRWLDEE